MVIRAASSLVLCGALLASVVVASVPASASSLFDPARLVSAAADGSPGSAFDSHNPSVSADGRYVAFVSRSDGLAGTTGAHEQVFRKDLQTGAIVPVSVTSAGIPGDDNSSNPSISADGRLVAFQSSSANLGASSPQVFVRDLGPGGRVVLISKNPSTGVAGNNSSGEPAISADGSTVVFSSLATDLITGAAPSHTQIYSAALSIPGEPLSFVSLQDPRRASVPDLASADAQSPSVSADGSRVAFRSAARNLTPDDTNGVAQIWVRDVRRGTTTLVSVVGDGLGGDGDSAYPQISGDGALISFASTTKFAGGPRFDYQIYSRDMTEARVRLVSASPSGLPGAGTSDTPVMSTDGTAIAFVSRADLAPGTSVHGERQVYRRDLRTGRTALVSTRAGSLEGAPETTIYPAISGDGRVVAFTSSSTDLVSTPVPAGVKQVYVRRVAGPAVERIGGADRFAVAARVAGASFGTERPVVYVATGAGFADALSASAAAGAEGGPVVLVSRDTIPAETASQLARLHPARIVIAGGPNSVSVEVERLLGGYGAVERIGGVDRYAVSAAISARAFTSTPLSTVYLASGAVFPDALAGAAATTGRSPVLLVTRDTVPDAVRNELNRLAPSRIVVLGGINTISDALLATLPSSARVTRLGGSDRFAVSASVSAATFTDPVDTAYVASGAVFPDALSGSAAAIIAGAPMLLVTADAIPPLVAAELTRLAPRRIVVLGGPATISDAVKDQLVAFLPPR